MCENDAITTWFWLITRQFCMTSKLISEGLLYELVSNTAFLVCQKYRYYLQVSWCTCAITDAPSSFQRNFPERLEKTPIWLLACTIHCMNGFIHFTWKMLQTIFRHRIMLRWETKNQTVWCIYNLLLISITV